jgi:site-specific DNA-methyltransferase (adenine-specific)
VSPTSKVVLYSDDTLAWHLIEADANLALAQLPADSVDAILTDPPYALGIVGEAWDGRDIRRSARRDGLRLSGAEAFEHWTRQWAAECRRVLKPGGHLLAFGAPRTFHRLVCGVEDAGLEVRDTLMWLFVQGLPKSRKLPGGLATSLKPAYEPIVLARKPLDGTTTANLAAWGTGALNIDAARLSAERYWPAHVALAHAPDCASICAAECPAGLIDRAAPKVQPSRLFFCAKAPQREREAGCEQLPVRPADLYTGRARLPRARRNIHPTVKPVALTRWLVQLITPPGGIVLDPFAGSGTTGIGAVLEDRRFVGIEREGKYVDIACARLTHWAATCGTQRESLS